MLPLILMAGAALWAQPNARFHHVHLNSADPAAAAAFYARKFACEQAAYAGKPAIWAQKSWLLFDRVSGAPPPGAPESDSPVWHIGWGAEDMPATYKRQLESGTKFHTPLTDISDLANFQGFYYAYVEGPDRALIELNTARHSDFGHLHLFSSDPHAAADWYARYLGVTPRKSRPEVRMYRDVQVGPSASFTVGNVNVIVYPAGYRKHNRFRSSRGTVFDHVAFSVDNLDATLQAMRAAGVKVLRPEGNSEGHRSVIVEGPDLLAVEIVQGHAQPPALPRAALPEFIAGDQCLFCHRNDIGPGWQKNRHNLTIQLKQGTDDAYTLGARERRRALRKTGYGRFAIEDAAGWHATKFNDRCAGCHATAVDAATKAFAAVSIDCYACHGVVDLEHANDTTKILLSKKRGRDARQIASICGSCHLRGGYSLAKGFPYAWHYVAGDDLFADYVADLDQAADAGLNPGDRHVYRNVRDVLQNNSDVSCLSCHAVHGGSSDKHRRVRTSAACLDCHYETGPKKNVKRYTVRSRTCEY